jgi:SRSO17 transposase
MMLTKELGTPPLEHDAAMVQGGAAYMREIERRLAPSFERAEPRQRAMASLCGLLSPAERKNSWQLAEVNGDATPYAIQHLLRRARWDPEAVREERHRYGVQPLEAPEAVLVVDEPGFLTKGRHSAGVARPYSGTAGRVEHCQLGVLLGSASALGPALLDRELYLPQEWTDDRERCRQAGLPAARSFAPKPQLARQLLTRAFAAGTSATWITGDSVYGDDRRLRVGLEAPPQASVLAVSGKEDVGRGGQQRRVNTSLAALPEDEWRRLSAGDGAKGPRWDDWRWLPLAEPLEPTWRRGLLIRRSLSDTTEMRASGVLAPQETTLEAGVRVAGARWTIEQLFEAAKGAVGLDQYEVRSWTGWYRQITLAMWALALLTVMRAGAIAVETFKKNLPPAPPQSSLAAFKGSRGRSCR